MKSKISLASSLICLIVGIISMHVASPAYAYTLEDYKECLHKCHDQYTKDDNDLTWIEKCNSNICLGESNFGMTCKICIKGCGIHNGSINPDIWNCLDTCNLVCH